MISGTTGLGDSSSTYVGWQGVMGILIKLVLRVADIGPYTHIYPPKEMGGGGCGCGDGRHWSLLLEWVWHISQLACWGCGGLMVGLGAGIGVGY